MKTEPKKRYAYVVIQDDTNWPVNGRSDVQRHVLGCHSNLPSAMKHLRSCVSDREMCGLKVLWDKPISYPRGSRSQNDNKEWSVYMSKEDRTNTCEFIVERYLIVNKLKQGK